MILNRKERRCKQQGCALGQGERGLEGRRKERVEMAAIEGKEVTKNQTADCQE